MPREALIIRRTSTLLADAVRGKVGAWLMGLAVFLLVIPWPPWLSNWLAGFLISALLFLFSGFLYYAGWMALFMAACVLLMRDLLTRRKKGAVLWLGVGLGIVLARFTGWPVQTPSPSPSPHAAFGRGIVARLEIRSDIDAIRTWVASLDPNDCRPLPHDASRGRWLSKKERPTVLKRQGDSVSLELDAEGRPCVRLEWDQSKAGVFGLVIGHGDMKTPPSEPGMYGEKRTELGPGIYFWYCES